MKEKVLGRGVLSQERWNLGLQINVPSSATELPSNLYRSASSAGIVWSTYQLLFRSSIMMIKTVNVQVEDEAVIFPLAANQTRRLHLLFHIYFRPNQPLHTKRNNQPHQFHLSVTRQQ
ncbi:hypothetical protein NC653_038074 [Populus alba x Populus x berolinensis]|uniref:Uncharacterized protein n=1 Tax=Populus alba x Populus x berolinensis TaxID=444605 RepID=A0AAD6LFQ3_9ROSI|nr:hypothetical protein NC653_038074 [Populus alba x Populus x berolinensis]